MGIIANVAIAKAFCEYIVERQAFSHIGLQSILRDKEANSSPQLQSNDGFLMIQVRRVCEDGWRYLRRLLLKVGAIVPLKPRM